MMERIKPVLKYPGSKWRLADWIVAHMPPHKVYVEPYAGSLAVFFTKHPAGLSTINDINGHVVNLFRVMRERPEELASAVALTPWSREEYEGSYDRDLDTLSPVEAARRFLVRMWQGHGSSADQYRNGWRVVRDEETGPGLAPYRQWQKLPARVLAAADKLKDVQIECKPAVEVIKAFSQPGVLVYSDPPYLSSSTSLAKKGRKIYEFEMTDHEHLELLEVLKAHSGPVLASSYACPLYNDALLPAGWTYETKRAATEKGGSREEILWLNPAAAEALRGKLF